MPLSNDRGHCLNVSKPDRLYAIKFEIHTHACTHTSASSHFDPIVRQIRVYARPYVCVCVRAFAEKYSCRLCVFRRTQFICARDKVILISGIWLSTIDLDTATGCILAILLKMMRVRGTTAKRHAFKCPLFSVFISFAVWHFTSHYIDLFIVSAYASISHSGRLLQGSTALKFDRIKCHFTAMTELNCVRKQNVFNAIFLFFFSLSLDRTI